MNRETLHEVVKWGAMIPWGLVAYPLADGIISFSLVGFQFVCWDLYMRSDRN